MSYAIMIADPNIIAKVTFSANIAQFNDNGIQFIMKYACPHNGQVTENGFAIDPNSYLALINRVALPRPASLNNIKLRNTKDQL